MIILYMKQHSCTFDESENESFAESVIVPLISSAKVFIVVINYSNLKKKIYSYCQRHLVYFVQ